MYLFREQFALRSHQRTIYSCVVHKANTIFLAQEKERPLLLQMGVLHTGTGNSLAEMGEDQLCYGSGKIPVSTKVTDRESKRDCKSPLVRVGTYQVVAMGINNCYVIPSCKMRGIMSQMSVKLKALSFLCVQGFFQKRRNMVGLIKALILQIKV